MKAFGVWFGGLALGAAVMGAASIFDQSPMHWYSVIPCAVIGAVLTVQATFTR